CMQSLEFPLIF
nr:immunoglobulin light chain junction region [Macaca mulatta]